jgi:hypothetical protein
MASFADELHAINSRILRTEIASLKDKFYHEFLPGCRHPRGKHRDEPITLYEYQREMIDEFFKHQVNIWEIGRQGAKTSTAALLLAFLSRELTGDAIISSFRMERSTELVDWVKGWCKSHTDPGYAENLGNDATEHAYFKTGFRVKALPHGQTARGFTTALVITDESQLMDDEDLSALLPTGLTTAPKRLHMGTVWGSSGWFWRMARSADQFRYHLIHITSEEALAPHGPILKPELDRLQLELGEPQYNQECLLIPIPDITTFFGEEIVKQATDDYIRPTLTPQSTVIVGWDHAVSAGDESVAFVGILDQKMNIISEYEVRRWLNISLHQQANEISQAYPDAYYCLDSTAEGGKIALDEARRCGLNVSPIDFSKSKPTLMITHKNRMQQGLFKFQDEKTRIQHLNYKFSESETVKGRYKYGAPGNPDDRVDAAALADYQAHLLQGHTGESLVFFSGGKDEDDSFIIRI